MGACDRRGGVRPRLMLYLRGTGALPRQKQKRSSLCGHTCVCLADLFTHSLVDAFLFFFGVFSLSLLPAPLSAAVCAQPLSACRLPIPSSLHHHHRPSSMSSTRLSSRFTLSCLCIGGAFLLFCLSFPRPVRCCSLSVGACVSALARPRILHPACMYTRWKDVDSA